MYALKKNKSVHSEAQEPAKNINIPLRPEPVPEPKPIIIAPKLSLAKVDSKSTSKETAEYAFPDN